MEYKQCTRCVMDNESDKGIRFEEDGTCHYCNKALKRKERTYFPNPIGTQKLNYLIDLLKREGKNKKYDCIMGLSGGLDSAYLAYLGATQWKLRILAVHVDDGFDTEVAKENNQKIASSCGLTLINEEIDQTQYFDLVKSFLKAGVPNIAIPQDNLIFGYMHKYAKEYGIKYFLSGANFALESILQGTHTHSAFDRSHILDIHERFGEGPINNLHITSLFRRTILDRLQGIKTATPLNYIAYNRDRAIEELHSYCGYNYYGGKHYESVFTKFLQAYYLPMKYGVDKRKSHFSSMIVSDQMTRSDALHLLRQDLYDPIILEKDISFIIKKLKFTRKEFDTLLRQSPVPHSTYKTYSKIQLVIFKGITKIATHFGF